MTASTKAFLALAVVILGGAIYGAYLYPQVSLFGASSSGTTYNTAKQASVVASLALPGANATSSSILNTDSTDRYVTSIKIGCQSLGSSQTAYTGTGLASNGLTLKVATSSTSAPATNSNTNLVGAGSVIIATTSPQFVEASSTAATAVPNTGSSYVGNIWGTNTYMTFTTNATNTATCTFGVDYFGS